MCSKMQKSRQFWLCTDWIFFELYMTVLKMSQRSSSSHVFLVRQQSFIPTYFSPSEFQTTQNKRDSDSNLDGTPAYIDENESTYYADYYHEDHHTLQSHLCGSEASIHSLLQFLENCHHIREIQTTRLRSSALASLFSCNVSKMTSESKAKLDCDGYFGCPEEKKVAKDNGKIYSIISKISYFYLHLSYDIHRA